MYEANVAPCVADVDGRHPRQGDRHPHTSTRPSNDYGRPVDNLGALGNTIVLTLGSKQSLSNSDCGSVNVSMRHSLWPAKVLPLAVAASAIPIMLTHAAVA